MEEKKKEEAKKKDIVDEDMMFDRTESEMEQARDSVVVINSSVQGRESQRLSKRVVVTFGNEDTDYE